MPSPRHSQVYICPLEGTRCCGHCLSRNMLGSQVQAMCPNLHAWRQAVEVLKTTFPANFLSCCLPSRAVGRKTQSSEESKLEQLSYNESFLPPQDYFISNSVIFVNNEQISSERHYKIFQITTNAYLIFIKFA